LSTSVSIIESTKQTSPLYLSFNSLESKDITDEKVHAPNISFFPLQNNFISHLMKAFNYKGPFPTDSPRFKFNLSESAASNNYSTTAFRML
jgi:hypothetical protein